MTSALPRPETTADLRERLAGLPGLDPAWSRTVTVPGPDGARTWHYLDNGAQPVHGTMLCVHGNPTWSYLWRRFVAEAPEGWRVVAPDQLGMGFSERTPARDLATRVADLGRFTEAAGIAGPVVLAVHDWGGAIGLGWALEHRELLAGIVLTNTAVWQPQDRTLPGALRLVTHRALHSPATVLTDTFVRATTGVSIPTPPKDVRAAYALPYRSRADRAAVGQFVADIPAFPGHPSHETLRAVAEGVATLTVPTLALWGPEDPVFTDLYLRDLLQRLPQTDVHRFPLASHLVQEDSPECAAVAWRWVGSALADAAAPLLAPGAPAVPAAVDTAAPVATGRLPWRALLDLPDSSVAPRLTDVAIREMSGASITFGDLRDRVRNLARGMVDAGLTPGSRLGVLIQPGIDLTVAVYAAWAAGAVVVVADAGLGYGKLAGALTSAHVDGVLATPLTSLFAETKRIPGQHWVTGEGSHWAHDDAHYLTLLERAGAESTTDLPTPEPGADCAILFTSGATGPSKGVVYTNAQISAQVETLRATFGFGPQEAFVAAFSPFALYGPALLMPSVVPDIDVTKPDTLTAAKLADAVAAIDATLVFAAPAALRNIVATAPEATPEQRDALARPRLLLSAGAPIPAGLLREVKQVLAHAETHTPYGMTEALPVTDLDPTAQDLTGAGVCVGRPVVGAEVALAPLDHLGVPAADLTDAPDVLGEIAVRGAHVKDRYLNLWATQQDSARNPGWHRTGDIGHLDAAGNLWVEGRLQHVVTTPDGPLAPVAVEHAVQAIPHVEAAACVGVGPAGTQAVVVVVQPEEGVRVRGPLAPRSLSSLVRRAVDVPVAAVLLRRELPTDIRHRSKVDRAALAEWAAGVLAGTDAPGARLKRMVTR